MKLESLSNLMQIDEADLKSYFEIKRSHEQKLNKQKKVKFMNPHQMDLTKYLACFEVPSVSNADSSRKRFYNLNKTITYKHKQLLGGFYFQTLLRADHSYDPKQVQDFLFSIPLKKIQLLVNYLFYEGIIDI